MRSYGWDENLTGRLGKRLARGGLVFAPVTEADGVCRLKTVEGFQQLEGAALPRLPLKKLVLPASDLLWTLETDSYRPPALGPQLAVVGIAPCDLYALAYLDQAFAEDSLYQQRRSRMLLVGATCTQPPPVTAPLGQLSPPSICSSPRAGCGSAPPMASRA